MACSVNFLLIPIALYPHIAFLAVRGADVSFNNPVLSYKSYRMLLFSAFHAKKPNMYLSSSIKTRLTADLICGLQSWINASAGNGNLIQLYLDLGVQVATN